MTHLGQYLRAARRAAKRPIRDVAGLLGVSGPYLSFIERGLRNVPRDRLDAFADAYGCPVSDLTARYVCPHCGRGAR